MHQSYSLDSHPDTEKVVSAIDAVLGRKGLTLGNINGAEHEPAFWEEVAIEAFGKRPMSSKDPLWDRLLPPGIRYLHPQK